MLTRQWQRGITATYSYDDASRQTGIEYSDSTPDVAHTYDRAGRRVTTADAAGTHTFTYDDLTSGGQLNTWSVAGTGAWAACPFRYHSKLWDGNGSGRWRAGAAGPATHPGSSRRCAMLSFSGSLKVFVSLDPVEMRMGLEPALGGSKRLKPARTSLRWRS